MNLIVRLDEKQKHIESFFLHRSPRETEYLNYFLGKNYYRDINLYFVYDRPNRQWFTAGKKIYNEVMCEKLTNPNFKLNAFMKKFYYTEKKGNGYIIGTRDQRRSLGRRSYLIPLIWNNDDIWIAKNEIFYTTANAAQMREKTFLKNIRYVGSYWLEDKDEKQLLIFH